MCKFMSALIMRNGDLLCDPEHTDSHEHIVAMHSLRDEGHLGAGGRDWARIEFTPPSDRSTICDLSAWTLSVDENATPDWLDLDAVRAACVARVERMIVREDRAILVGGPWIITAGRMCKIIGRIVAVLPGADLVGARWSMSVDPPSGWSRLDSGVLIEEKTK
jgi:hypothetical protein